MLRLAALLLAFAAPVQAACVLRAEVPVRLRDGFPFVPATIGGVPVTMLLDTGAQGMLITPDAAAALALPADPGRGTRLLGTGGSRTAPNVLLRGLALGGAALPDASVPVAPLPGVPQTEPPLAGLLGAPLLAAYDVELDVPRGRMALFDTLGCAPPPRALRLVRAPDGEALLPVIVNGLEMLAVLDTGSRATILTEDAARRLGLVGPPSANVARGIDGAPMPVRHTRVARMQVGAELRTDVPVSVSPLQLGGGDMLLGLDYLGRRRVWMSYRSGRVAFGDPVAQER